MKAEYFPPKEDVILQNEAPTDFYILVTGAVVIVQLIYVNNIPPFQNLAKFYSNRMRFFFLLRKQKVVSNALIVWQDLVIFQNGVEQASPFINT